MKHVFLCLVLFICECSSVNRVNVHKSMHVFGVDGEQACTAYAVGIRSFITASHCIGEDSVYDIDGKILDTEKILVDADNDHTIFILKSARFKDYIRPVFARPVPGERVFTFGNPLAISLTDQYREGYVTGVATINDRTFNVFNMNMVPGDSGTLYFNMQGRIVGADFSTSHGFTISFPFGFTKEQLREIR